MQARVGGQQASSSPSSPRAGIIGSGHGAVNGDTLLRTASVSVLRARQLGHAVTRVRGLHETEATVELTRRPEAALWSETFCLDRRDAGHVHRARVRLGTV